MTAVVGILNKQAVAVAADSAVTITGAQNRKIFNHANKIFRLSRQQPLGVMLYNSADFMGTPWEIIFKNYRDYLGNGALPALVDYQEDFLNFLRQQSYFKDENLQKHSLFNYALALFETLTRDALKGYHEMLIMNHLNRVVSLITPLVQQKIEEVWNEIQASPLEPLPDFEGIDIKYSPGFDKNVIKEAIKRQFDQYGLELDDAHQEQLIEIVGACLAGNRQFFQIFTGVVFVGFGAEENFPGLSPINISFPLQNRLRYFVDEKNKASISHEQPSAICPFAQTDVIDTLLAGADSQLREVFVSNFNKFLKKYNDLIISELSPDQERLKQQISNINQENLVNEYVRLMEEVQYRNYIMPLMGAVGTLSKEDLAEMAESLIYLTYLKRRITFAEESVGGPVDVAIISKCDGFIWKKRKHYFRPELNPHYFSTFLR